MLAGRNQDKTQVIFPLHWVNAFQSSSSIYPSIGSFIILNLSVVTHCFSLKLNLNFYPLPVNASIITINVDRRSIWFLLNDSEFSLWRFLFYDLIIKISTSLHFNKRLGNKINRNVRIKWTVVCETQKFKLEINNEKWVK